MLTTFAYALATTVFPYSGIAHHDALATGYLVLAFYLVFQISRGGAPMGAATILASAAAGLLLGLTVTTSMLAFFMALVCAIYFHFAALEADAIFLGGSNRFAAALYL